MDTNKMKLDSERRGEQGPVDVGPEERGSGRDPEERTTKNQREIREKMMDKTLADSFPSSDPPSTIPDPEAEDSAA